MNPDETTYTLSANDFDKSLLPIDARTPGTDAFVRAVSDFYHREYATFGGTVRVVVDATTISVAWRRGAGGPEPLQVAFNALQAGDLKRGVLLLELLRQRTPDDPDVLYNLGMALSDLGELDAALVHLRHAATVAPDPGNTLVAIGVALGRQGKWGEAVDVLERAVALEPDNPWAQRNLGACLLSSGHKEAGKSALRRAVDLAPRDQQALFGLAEALRAGGEDADADKLYARVLEVDARSPITELAKDARRTLAQQSFRGTAPAGVRMDAVMYLLGALKTFAKMDRKQVQQVAFEVAMAGQRGLDTNDPAQKYTLRILPGRYSGLHMVSLMYAGFKAIDPTYSIGFDLSKEYEVACSMLGVE